MDELMRIIMKQEFPNNGDIDVIEQLYIKKREEKTHLPYGVMCYLYGTIQGKRIERARKYR
ncbi:MAG: hypothetical protein HFE74_04420 [Firmicutes bacterium]|jgi:hypothetical protein|nr:hypothetical protein [Bacillota bacterium]